eukprot:TRINITY_DN48790_c0_g1_i1.p1 TRINITY_DN48790_c0_g1~~TRINITY_DN48790_c0_g1_i1.p1  ORF type:complete len:434 (-),score=69.29 TRINITY_DN48790_c0_g1_i1:65-1333(-)
MQPEMSPWSLWAGSLALWAALPIALASYQDDVTDMEQKIIVHGYPVQKHIVRTDDDYLLTAFRIPHGVAESREQGALGALAAKGNRPTVIVQHALLCSSFDWVQMGPRNSLAFILADAGFDVWLTNNRGNMFGVNHTTLSVDSAAFWEFTWDEMALWDLPANVDYVLKATGRSSVSYVGHSQGTIQAFAGFSRNAELSSKIDLFVALAPVAFVDHMTSPIFKILAYLGVGEIQRRIGMKEFLPSGSLLNKIDPTICSGVLAPLCNAAIFLFCGKSQHIDPAKLKVFLQRTPAGTSVKNMLHWSQSTTRHVFEMFDYGSDAMNMAVYHQATPPAYDLRNVTVKTALFTGQRDILADPDDVKTIVNTLPNASLVHWKDLEDYAHLDFAWGENANASVYQDVLQLLRQYGGDSFVSQDQLTSVLV